MVHKTKTKKTNITGVGCQDKTRQDKTRQDKTRQFYSHNIAPSAVWRKYKHIFLKVATIASLTVLSSSRNDISYFALSR